MIRARNLSLVKKTNYNICNDKTQEASTPAPVGVPESMPAIDVVPKNEPENAANYAMLEAKYEPENKPEHEAVLEAEPAADALPQNDPDATEEAAGIDNA